MVQNCLDFIPFTSKTKIYPISPLKTSIYETNTNSLNILTLHVVIASPKGVAIRRSHCEGKARGNLKSSLASLGTRLRRSTPPNDKLLVAFVLEWLFSQSRDWGRVACSLSCGP
jgi:hypothetical protein